MSTFKCRHCGNEYIRTSLPIKCECCGTREFFIDYTSYLQQKTALESTQKQLQGTQIQLAEKASFETKIKRLTAIENQLQEAMAKISKQDTTIVNLRSSLATTANKLAQKEDVNVLNTIRDIIFCIQNGSSEWRDCLQLIPEQIKNFLFSFPWYTAIGFPLSVGIITANTWSGFSQAKTPTSPSTYPTISPTSIPSPAPYTPTYTAPLPIPTPAASPVPTITPISISAPVPYTTRNSLTKP